MSIFGSILRKIFPANHPAVTGSTSTSGTGASTPAGSTATGTTPAKPAAPAATTSASMPPVDVEAVLSGMASKNSQQLNWRESIVDLMKLLGLDSSLESRKELAKELGYTGSTADSAAMNIWLHKQVMTKLAQNGGKVPQELKV